MNKQNISEVVKQYFPYIDGITSIMSRNKYLVFFAGIVAIIYISGTLEIDQNIADKSQGYFVHRNIGQANEAARLGYIKYEVNDYAQAFGISWSSKPGVRRIIRSGSEDFDSIGYISFLELIAITGKNITITFMEKLHNYAFIISAAVLSCIVFAVFKNVLAGWIFMTLVLVLKSNILSLVYGSPDNRTFVIIFPFLVVSMIFGLNWLSAHLDRFWGWVGALVLFFGLLLGMMASVRNGEGLPALLAVLFLVILLKVGVKQKATLVVTLISGYLLIMVAMPIAFALHRDIKTGEFNGNITPYLQTTGNHPLWHSILLGAGKYPNQLGISYNDVSCYTIVRARYPEAMHPVHNFHVEGYFKAARTLYLDYVIHNPAEYFTNLTKASAELVFFFIPYTTSAGNLTWSYGYLPIKPGITPDANDLAPARSSLINLRYRYLKLSPIEWGVYILAVLAIALAVRLSLRGVFGRDNKSIFLATGFYMLLLGTTRVLIPQHGLALITCFWTFSIISLLYLSFTENAVRDFVYLRSQKLLSNLTGVVSLLLARLSKPAS